MGSLVVIAVTQVSPSSSGSTLWVGVFGGLGVVATAFVTWLIARRKGSGRVDTSEASSLWEESRSMRQQLSEEAAALRDEVAQARSESAAMKARADVETRRADRAEDNVAALREQIAELRARLDMLERGYVPSKRKPKSKAKPSKSKVKKR